MSITRGIARVLQRELRLIRSPNAANYYENMGFDVLAERETVYENDQTPLWLNYGYWKGARKAVDEFFEKSTPRPMLHRIDYTGRICVKP